MSKTEDKLDKIIKLLEEIKADQPLPYYPPIPQQLIIYPPGQPYTLYPPNESPWQPGDTWWWT